MTQYAATVEAELFDDNELNETLVVQESDPASAAARAFVRIFDERADVFVCARDEDEPDLLIFVATGWETLTLAVITVTRL